MHGPVWDPAQYDRFASERERPFFDLLARVPSREFQTIVDLGCGTGRLTEVLAQMHPRATVVGVDRSPEMLAEARQYARSVRVVEADLTAWEPDGPVSLLFSNAVLHWVPQHVGLLPKFASWLDGEGVMAVQVPANFDAPSHEVLKRVTAQGPWRQKVAGLAEEPRAPALSTYAEALLDLGLQVDAWETVYHHMLAGPDPVLEWLKGTALRPILAKLAHDESHDFLEALGEALRRAYPATGSVTAFPFRRRFFVAKKPA